ncbi:MAG: CBS domain-containing protein [Candidatus Marsarchaeota archaeon]|jgi:predicted transcriptional regulator|nr:CBS domain-containing protein [Candidatus Marsarchaeota archaeon]MCL5112344.1 CBS domain-containing protein [Candidatus Marsarchaeota archaeon]
MLSFPRLDSIGRRRKLLGVTQQRLAKMCGISQSLLAKIESGNVNPSYTVAVSLFEMLDALEQNGAAVAKDIMKKEIVVLNPKQRIGDVAKISKLHVISQFPVAFGGRLVGSITTKDMLDAPKDATVGAFLSDQLPTVSESTPIEAVKQLLKSSQAVIVLNKDRIVGIITAEDLL